MVRNNLFLALFSMLFVVAVLSEPCLAQLAKVEQKSKTEPDPDKKAYEVMVKESKPKEPEPKGKYIVGEPITIEVPGSQTPNITLNICSGPATQPDCRKLDQPAQVNSMVFIRATNPLTNPVRISVTVSSGEADIQPYADRVGIVPKQPGRLVLKVDSIPKTSPHSPWLVTLHVDGIQSSELSCARLLPPTIQKLPMIDASKIVGLIGAPQPYVLEAIAKDKILIYSTRPPQGDVDKVRRKLLDDIRRQITSLSALSPFDIGFQPPPFSIDLYVPHARALNLNELVASATSGNNSKLTVTSIGSDRIRVTSASQPGCEAWVSFLTELRRLVWARDSEPLIARLFYQEAGEVRKALSGQSAPAGAAQPGITVSDLGKEFLVFGDNKSDDSVREKKRLLAQLDLPRPEMIINAWVMQNSSKDPKVVTEFSDIVQWTVRSFNNQIEKSVAAGWSYLKQQIVDPPRYFERSFHNYIARRYVGELRFGSAPTSAALGAQEVLNLRSGATLAPPARDQLEACTADEYCLGYNAVFNPLKPRLTDLLITVIAANDPVGHTTRAVAEMEKGQQRQCEGDRSHQDYCKKMLSHLRLSDADFRHDPRQDCRVRDRAAIYNAAKYGSPPPMFLQCFKEKAIGIFSDAPGSSQNPDRISQLGLLRSAIADFLFHYKMSQQYPHEFVPYELSQSADVLNTALAPFIEGFNQDVEAYQDFLKAELRYRIDRLARARHWHILPEARSFINNGTVSVRTISGSNTSVNAVTQSFLDASKAPSISELVTNIASENPPKGDNGNPTGILGNMSFNQAQLLLGALKSYQSSTVQIGRQLSLDFTPRSLSTASSAEIEVTLKAGEPAPPTYFGGTKGGQQAEVSRVASHDTKTRIRIDSIKLFEVSSFTAELQKSRSRFPLLPPFVELPYIGTLAGIPLPPAKVYHTSTAVMSAIVVPTAADLAWGLAFIQDRILDPFCDRCIGNDRSPDSRYEIHRARPAISLKDLGDRPVRNFHKRKILCFTADSTQAARLGCDNLSFDMVPHEPL